MQKEVKPTGLTSLKGLKVSPFNELENSKGVKVKPLVDQNNFVEKNKGIKVNPLHNIKSCIEDKISPNKESDYMENYKPWRKGVVPTVHRREVLELAHDLPMSGHLGLRETYNIVLQHFY